MVVVQLVLSNAVFATVLAVFVAAIGKVTRRPQVRHALWVLVLVKLVTPPLVCIPVEFAGRNDAEPPILLERRRTRRPSNLSRCHCPPRSGRTNSTLSSLLQLKSL